MKHSNIQFGMNEIRPDCKVKRVQDVVRFLSWENEQTMATDRKTSIFTIICAGISCKFERISNL